MTTDAKPKKQGESRKLTLQEIDHLSDDEFARLPEEDRERFRDYMNRDNLPTAAEFYGYADELEPAEPISYPGDEAEPTPLFPLGKVDISIHAVFFLTGGDIDEALILHASGNWGECDPQTWKINDHVLKEEGRITSVYRTKAGKLFFVITEISRGKTRVVTAEDY